MPAFKFDVDQFTVFELILTESYIDIAKGKSKDKMSRGSYTSKEILTDRRRLFYQGFDNGKHCFKDQEITVYATAENGDFTHLKFEAIDGYNRLWFYLNALPEEKIYGCGEQFTHFNLKTQTVPIWVSEHHSVKKLIKKYVAAKLKLSDDDYLGRYQEHASYYAQPTFMSSFRYAVHVDSVAYATFSFHPTQTVLYFREFPKTIHFFKAPSFIELAQTLNRHLGIQPKLPYWIAEGVILAIQGGVETIQSTLDDALKNGIKVTAVWAQDWSGQTLTKFGQQVYWHWTVDEQRYANLKHMIAEWEKQGIYFLGYMNPFLKQGSPQYALAKKQGYLVKKSNHTPYLIKSTTFNAGLIDLTNTQAYHYIKTLIKEEMLDLGFAGWMADFGEYLPTDSVIAASDPLLVHNQYPELWAQCHKEAIDEHPNDAFIFTRSAYTKSVKYTHAMWVGDQHVDFSDQYGLGSVIPAYLSMAVSGVGINHSDTGGYTTIFHMKRSAELLIRWAEMNVFSPLFRTHEGNLPQRNVQFNAPETMALFAKLTQLYQGLSPYHKHVRHTYYDHAIPTIRPLFYHYDEPFAYDMQKAYMYGEDLLVAPVLRPNVRAHTVQLPKGEWIHLITKKTYYGGIHQVPAPLGTPTAFYRAQSAFKTLFENL